MHIIFATPLSITFLKHRPNFSWNPRGIKIGEGGRILLSYHRFVNSFLFYVVTIFVAMNASMLVTTSVDTSIIVIEKKKH